MTYIIAIWAVFALICSAITGFGLCAVIGRLGKTEEKIKILKNKIERLELGREEHLK